MKKYIWAIAAGIMIAGVVTIVACSKDNETNQSVNPAFSSTKGGTTLNQLRNVMVAYYAACDSAFQADSTTFLSVCANNDTTNFLKVTGISSEMMAAYRTLALQELEDFVKDNPNFKPDENPCTSCSYNALPRLGTLASATSGHMAALVPFKIGGNDRQRLANCISWCEIMTTPCGMTACISACMGEYYQVNYHIFDRSHEIILCLTKACDDAYKQDSVEFLNICKSNDYDAFLSCIGISEELHLQMGELMMYEVQAFAEENPELVKEADSPCHDCAMYALPRIGDAVSNHSGNLEQIAYLSLDHCLFVCGLGCTSVPAAYPECVLACMAFCLLH